jgi:hypothetical protein
MVGFAWDIFGDGKTALRGGYGISYTRIFTNQDCSFYCVINPPAVQNVNLTGTAATPLTFPSVSGGAAHAVSVLALNNADLNIQATQVQTYSLGIQHEFPHNWLLSLVGAGSLGRHVVGYANINQPVGTGGLTYPCQIDPSSSLYPATAQCPTGGKGYNPYYYAPYLGYAGITTWATPFNQNWTALELGARHPVGRNVFLTVSYTWSHDLTNLTGTGLGSSYMTDVYNPGRTYGNAEGANYPQAFTASLVWTLPGQNIRGAKGVGLAGWRFSDLTTIRSGSSLTPGLNTTNSGFPARPDVVSGQSTTGPKTVAQWFNTSAYTYPAPGFPGDAGTGSILGPGLVDFDVALYKDFRLTERALFQFRAEGFNVFNHTNFSNPNASLGNPNFGKLTSARDPRILEFVLRLQF